MLLRLLRYGLARRRCRQITGQHRHQSKVINRYHNSLEGIKIPLLDLSIAKIRFNNFIFPNISYLNNGVWHIFGGKFDHISAALFERHEHFDIFVATGFVAVTIECRAFLQQQQHPCKMRMPKSDHQRIFACQQVKSILTINNNQWARSQIAFGFCAFKDQPLVWLKNSLIINFNRNIFNEFKIHKEKSNL
jgi:hypothetical protein